VRAKFGEFSGPVWLDDLDKYIAEQGVRCDRRRYRRIDPLGGADVPEFATTCAFDITTAAKS
jgi:hypothetical protein